MRSVRNLSDRNPLTRARASNHSSLMALPGSGEEEVGEDDEGGRGGELFTCNDYVERESTSSSTWKDEVCA